jgi:protein TonB
VGPSERRLTAASVAASVLLHAAALAVGPSLREPKLEPARVLSVVLAAPPAPVPAAEPPVPPAAIEPAPVAAKAPLPQAIRPERPQRALTPPAPARVEQPATPSATVASTRAGDATEAREEAPVAAPPQAPAAAASPAVGPAPVLPPDYRAAYLNNPAPPYPHGARRAGEQGTVLLRVLVGSDGAPVRVELDGSSGSGSLDAAARAAVQRWRFAPARRGDEPVEAWVRIPVVFRLAPDG